MGSRRTYAGVFLITLSVLMLELALTRLFSATMYYHFAFLAISLALLGSAGSGLFIYFIQHRLAESRTGAWLGLASALFGLSVLVTLFVVLANPLTLEAGAQNGTRLLAIYLATTLPFFFAGCAVTLAITRLAASISRLYLFDLAGAATGCLLLIPVINAIGAIDTVLLVAALAAVAGVVLSTSAPGERGARAFTAVVAAGLLALLAGNAVTHTIDVRVAKGQKESHILFAKWNSFSRITVSGELTGDLRIRIDADAAAHVVRGVPDRKPGKLPGIRTLAHYMKKNADVLVIGAGGGRDVAAAYAFGARQIMAVEINPIIARDVMSSEPFKSYSGSLFEQPGVTLVVDEGRSFIRSHARRYDIIQAAMVDTWAATAAGAFALTENNLYTVEAFKDYVTHLNDDGILTLTRWYFEPPDQMLRLVAISRAMMTELGLTNPSRHFLLARDAGEWGDESPATLLFKKSELTDEEIVSFEEVCAARRLEVLYSPRARPANVFTRMIEAEDPAEVWETLPSNVAPVRDNNPFFFNSLRVSNLPQVFGGVAQWQKTNLGTFVLFLLLGITIGVVVVFLFGPLWLTQGRRLMAKGAGPLRALFYFGCLGAGFIIVEVAMVQKFILFLGHPVYALAVVLFSLLLFSAAGSYVTAFVSIDRLRSALLKTLGALCVLVVVYILVLPVLFYGLVHLPLPLRVTIAVALMAPLAVLMGTPMPAGIRLLAQSSPDLVPWAWGVNGATSVMGSVAALVIALLSGFNQALLVGAALYAAAALLGRRQ